MANLIDINDIPELTKLEGTEKVLLNVDGDAKQVQAELIKPGYDIIAEVTGIEIPQGDSQTSPYFTFNTVKAPDYSVLKDIILTQHRPIRGLFYGKINFDGVNLSVANDFKATIIFPRNLATEAEEEAITGLIIPSIPSGAILVTINAKNEIKAILIGGK